MAHAHDKINKNIYYLKWESHVVCLSRWPPSRCGGVGSRVPTAEAIQCDPTVRGVASPCSDVGGKKPACGEGQGYYNHMYAAKGMRDFGLNMVMTLHVKPERMHTLQTSTIRYKSVLKNRRLYIASIVYRTTSETKNKWNGKFKTINHWAYENKMLGYRRDSARCGWNGHSRSLERSSVIVAIDATYMTSY